jgi:hypothetical protein
MWRPRVDHGQKHELRDATQSVRDCHPRPDYRSRILRLALLAPDIVEAILAGGTDQGMMLEQLERPLPASWKEQRGWLADGRARLR